MIKLKEYYKSKHWRKFRSTLLDDINAECEICHRKKWAIYKKNTKKHKKGDKKRLLILTVHHLNYDCLNHESRKDVLVLCRFCHQLGHDLQRASVMSSNPYLKIYNLFKKITKWDYQKHD